MSFQSIQPGALRHAPACSNSMVVEDGEIDQKLKGLDDEISAIASKIAALENVVANLCGPGPAGVNDLRPIAIVSVGVVAKLDSRRAELATLAGTLADSVARLQKL